MKSGKGTYAYDVNIARSKDGGTTWGKPIVPHTDKTQTEHGFVSLIPPGWARWRDLGRRSQSQHVKEEGDDHTLLPVSMTLRYAAIDADGKLSDETQLDERVCECAKLRSTNVGRRTGGYRDRSDKEIRDIHL